MGTACRGDNLEIVYRDKENVAGRCETKWRRVSQKTFAASSRSLVSDPVSRYCPRSRESSRVPFSFGRQTVRMLYLASSSSKETPIIHANGFKRFEFVVAGRAGSTDGKRATGPRCSKMGRPDDDIFRCNVLGSLEW